MSNKSTQTPPPINVSSEISLEDIQRQLTLLETMMDNVIIRHNRMDEHIDWVERVYARLQEPLEYISSNYRRIARTLGVML